MIGHARVLDGDTVEVSGEKVRLHGIDAPERDQVCLKGDVPVACGREATEALRDMIDGRSVTCEGSKHDRYGRLIGVCRVDGVDLNGMMARTGHGVAYRKYSRDYVGEEAMAKAEKLGLWGSEFMMPWEWRKH